MEVQILSTETIKPLFRTPIHKRSYKLNLCDQLQLLVPTYAPTVLFYKSSSIKNPIINRSTHLKQSLSEALTYYYPFAGRLKDCFTIDCNDEGALFMEAQVDSDMSIVLEEPEFSRLQQLLPFDPNKELFIPVEPSARVMVAVQVNYFACGGMAIGVCINHVIADGSALASFLNNWAAIAFGSGANRIDPVSIIYDSTTLFTPQDISESFNLVKEKGLNFPIPEAKLVTKRFVFEGDKISRLIRREIGKIASPFEAVMALIWAAMIEITRNDRKEDENNNLPSVATMALNLRSRVRPRLPRQCIGNAIHVEMAESPAEKSEINLSSLAAKIRESARKVNDGYIKKLIANGECLDVMRHRGEKFGKNYVLHVSSCCGFRFYEIDFGWGKPIWLAIPLAGIRYVTFVDTSDGKGIELWLTLTEEQMAKLERDPAILTYATFKPSV